MPVVPMQKAAVIGHALAQDEVLSHLQKIELLELTTSVQEEKAAEEKQSFELELNELESAVRFLESASGKKKSLIETFAPPKEVVNQEQLELAAREFDWKAVVARIKDLEARLINAKNLEHTLRQELQTIAPWQKLNLKLNQLTCLKNVCVAAGGCKLRDFAPLKNKLEKFSFFQQIEVVYSDREKIYFMVFFLASEEKIILDFLSKTGFEKVILPASDRTPLQEMENIQKILREATEDRKSVLNEIRSLLKHLPRLTYVYDYLFQKETERAAREKLARTRRTFIITGWVPQSEFSRLRTGLQKVTSLVEVLAVRPQKDETPPVLIHNPKIFYPFELITRIFGLPARGEIDPTGALSFFYLFFFALCLSDVGYGSILSVVSYYYLRKLTLSEGGKKLLLLLFWGGIATVFIGILTGSYFGIDASLLPPVLKQLQIIDPIKNPMNVLIFSLVLGAFQNLTGIAIAMYSKIRNRDYLNALLDDGLWIFFLTCLVLLVGASGMGSPLAGLFGRLSILGGVLLTLTQGRNEPGIVKKAIFGILSLYKTTAYLGDTLSYSRLLALMMTTSIIGMVINIIAGMTRGIPFIGYFLMIAILIFGHVFNLVVSTLGAFIHSARLQLVEFFGKFYGGGGRPFNPFRRETKYVIIK